MAEGSSVAAITAVEQQAGPRSFGSYQSWLSQEGYMPMNQVTPNHPGELVGKIAQEATALSGKFSAFKDEMSTFFDPKRLVEPSRDAGPARHATPVLPGGNSTPPVAMPGGSAGPDGRLDPLEGAIGMLNETTTRVVEQQVRQMSALLQHNLSMQVLHTSIEASINTGKQVTRGLEQALRG